MNHLINEGGVCRTALATVGLFMTFNFAYSWAPLTVLKINIGTSSLCDTWSQEVIPS